jgi:hypothetical protein
VYSPPKKRDKLSKGIPRAQRSILMKSEDGMGLQEHRSLAIRKLLTL